MVGPESLVSHVPGLLATEIDGELVMMDVENGHYYNLDPIGTKIWKALVEPVRVSDLCAALEAGYEAPPGMVRADVLRLLGELDARGLLRVAA